MCLFDSFFTSDKRVLNLYVWGKLVVITGTGILALGLGFSKDETILNGNVIWSRSNSGLGTSSDTPLSDQPIMLFLGQYLFLNDKLETILFVSGI